jgi:hypothetical protein
MTRNEAIKYLQGIPEDEPVFVLRAQDKVAPAVVAVWGVMADFAGSPREKYLGSDTQALVMAQWQQKNEDKVKVPD